MKEAISRRRRGRERPQTVRKRILKDSLTLLSRQIPLDKILARIQLDLARL
jgi:hypothetical protein